MFHEGLKVVICNYVNELGSLIFEIISSFRHFCFNFTKIIRDLLEYLLLALCDHFLLDALFD